NHERPTAKWITAVLVRGGPLSVGTGKHGAAGTGQVDEEVRERRRGSELNRQIVDGRYLFDDEVIGAIGCAARLVAQTIHGVHDVVSGERRAIPERYAFLKLERPGQLVVTDLPALRKLRLDVQLHIVADETVVQ